jgi:hypothetical protein
MSSIGLLIGASIGAICLLAIIYVVCFVLNKKIITNNSRAIQEWIAKDGESSRIQLMKQQPRNDSSNVNENEYGLSKSRIKSGVQFENPMTLGLSRQATKT